MYPLQKKQFFLIIKILADMDLDLAMNLKLTTRNNVKYLDPVDTKSKITLRDVDLSFDGLFGGNRVLGKSNVS